MLTTLGAGPSVLSMSTAHTEVCRVIALESTVENIVDAGGVNPHDYPLDVATDVELTFAVAYAAAERQADLMLAEGIASCYCEANA